MANGAGPAKWQAIIIELVVVIFLAGIAYATIGSNTKDIGCLKRDQAALKTRTTTLEANYANIKELLIDIRSEVRKPKAGRVQD